MRRAAVLTALLLGGCVQADPAPTVAAELADTLAGRVAGAPQRCVSVTALGGPQIVGQTLVYRDGPRLWVNTPADGCPSLRGDPITIVEVQGGQVCRNDLFRTVDRGGIGIPGPYCRFGPFIPYTKPGQGPVARARSD